MMERYEIKRFLEYWTADEGFREHYQRDPVVAVAANKLEVEAMACQVLVDSKLASSLDNSQVHPGVKNFRAWIREKINHRRQHRQRCATSNPAFASWRQRQMNRYYTQVGPQGFDSNVHGPLTVELTLGCSVGCDYCGANAGKLRKIARFTSENEKLFRDLLRTMMEFLGAETDRGFLYYGTEPLDNPDYERYLQAFYEETGATPQTTTAAWDRDISRTSRVLEQSRAHNGMINRFSINTLEQFYFCMASFSAAELEDVELILQNPESTNVQLAVGRGRQLNPQGPEGTIACVSGFRVNLPERTIKLVSPSNFLSRYPGGEMVFAEGTFQDGPTLQAWLQDCQQRIMQFQLADHFVPQLRSDLEADLSEEGKTILKTKAVKVTIQDHLAQDVTEQIDGHRSVGEIVDALIDDDHESVNEIVAFLLERHEPANVYYTLNKWWQNGYLEDPFIMNQEGADGSMGH